jgi:lysozyme
MNKEVSMADTRAFGIDVSRYQGKIDWDVVAAHTDPKVIFTGIRATVSWGYQDTQFARNWSEAKRVGLLRMAYHVIYPSENATKQIDNLFSMVGTDLGELPLALDVELDQGVKASAIASNVLTQAQLIESRSGRKPIIYSRKSWVDVYMAGASWLNNYDWWLAIYLSSGKEHQGPPPLPKNVSKWLIHQSGSHGSPIGVQSLQLDYDRWNGDAAAVYKYAGVEMPASLTPTTTTTTTTTTSGSTPTGTSTNTTTQTWYQAIDAWARTKGYDGPAAPTS